MPRYTGKVRQRGNFTLVKEREWKEMGGESSCKKESETIICLKSFLLTVYLLLFVVSVHTFQPKPNNSMYNTTRQEFNDTHYIWVMNAVPSYLSKG